MHDTYTPTSRVALFREGCSSLHPFMLTEGGGSLMELPITIPEDFKVYRPELGSSSIVDQQLTQIAEIKKNGGLATLVVHPEPHFTVQQSYFDAFREVLRVIGSDRDCWICRPKDVYEFWKLKVASFS